MRVFNVIEQVEAIKPNQKNQKNKKTGNSTQKWWVMYIANPKNRF